MGVPYSKDSAERSAKGGCGGKVLSATGDVRDNADLEDVAYVMKEKSLPTLGDIKSVSLTL